MTNPFRNPPPTITIQTVLADPGLNLFQANPSQLAKQYPTAPVSFSAFGVLKDRLARLS
jgi:hypothetical protein